MAFNSNHIELADYINYRDWYLKRITGASESGDQLNGFCPFHDDQGGGKPSFTVNTVTGLWHCFSGCGGGNITSFVAKRDGITTKEAHKRICTEHNIPWNVNGSSSPIDRPAKEAKPKEAPREELVIPEDWWQQFGKFPDSWLDNYYAGARGWTREAIEKLDIRQKTHYYNPKKNKVAKIRKANSKTASVWADESSRVAIPIRDKEGRLRNVRFYHPDPPEHNQKIMSWAKGWGETRNFPAIPLDTDGPVYLFEGEPDVICAISHGILGAITHTSQKIEYNDDLLHPFIGRDVIIAQDADIPGQKRAAKAAAAISKVANSVRFLVWPDFMGRLPDGTWPPSRGLDLTNFLMNKGKTVEDFYALETVPEHYIIALILFKKKHRLKG